MDIRRVLQLIRDHLEKERHPFALVGAFALNAYGMGRATADLDFVAPQAAQAGVVAALEQLGFRTLHRSSGFSNHLHPDPEFGRVDFIYVDEATLERLMAGSRTKATMGSSVVVPSPEHLIAMKVHAIRNDPSRKLRDLADIQFLLRLPGVDLEQARGYFLSAGLEKEWDDVARKG